MNKKLNFAIIGLGRAGAIHLKNIIVSNKCILKYALDSDPDKLKFFEQEYHNVTTVYCLSDRYSTILEDPELDGVVITTPTLCHEQQILMALGKG